MATVTEAEIEPDVAILRGSLRDYVDRSTIASREVLPPREPAVELERQAAPGL